MRLKFFLLFLVLTGAYICHSVAQKQGQLQIDSLLKVLSNAKEDSNKAKLLYKLAQSMSRSSKYDEGVKYAKEYLELIKKLGLPQEKGYHILGILYARKSDYPKALEHFFMH